MWTERSNLKITWSGDAYTDAYESLDVLGEYVEDRNNMFESVDHVALFTGLVRCSLLGQFLVINECLQNVTLTMLNFLTIILLSFLFTVTGLYYFGVIVLPVARWCSG